MIIENGRRPTIEELKSIINSSVKKDRFNLTPSVETAIPAPKTAEDMEEALRDSANEYFYDELKTHPKLTTKGARLTFIQNAFNWKNYDLSRYLGITENQVLRKDLRGRGKKKINRFEERFNGTFAIASTLERLSKDVTDRKVALSSPNGLLSDLGVDVIMRDGKINIAVAITQMAVRQMEETLGYQK